MKKILILTTGGTIASVQSPDGLVPGLSSEQLRNHLPQIDPDIAIDIEELFHIDSTDMTAKHWITIIDAIRDHYEEYDGFVIAHGTDTMAYTAAVLSYMIQDSDKPIVLTGAQKPIGFEITDAKSNLQDSILYAADPHSKGVQIVFAGKAIAGTHARKVRSMSFLAFESINLPEVAEINSGRIIRYLQAPDYYKTDAKTEAASFCDEINTSVFLLKLTPSMTPELISTISSWPVAVWPISTLPKTSWQAVAARVANFSSCSRIFLSVTKEAEPPVDRLKRHLPGAACLA